MGVACGESFCCGQDCCANGQLCCDVPGPISSPTPKCYDPDPMTGSCPVGCSACKCASPDTPIATPRGDRPIAELAVGDLVYSVDHDAVVAVPIARINRTPVHAHHVVRMAMENGVVLEISAGHPTADGRLLGDVRAGDSVGGFRVLRAESVPYAHPFTYDILPASDTGAYFTGGVLMGSTLAQRGAR
jgi:hypothetical protein